MILSIYITTPNPTPGTLTLDMRDSGVDEGLIIFNMEGLGPPKSTVSGVGGPNLHGVKTSSIKVDARHIVLTLAVIQQIPANEETSKQKIYDFFPISKEITFRVETDTKDVQIQGIVESVEMNQFAKVENAVISLYCPDPYWAETSESSVEVTDGGPDLVTWGEVAGGCDIVATFDANVSSLITLTRQHAYAATETITISPSLAESISGVTIAVNDRIEVNTRRGQKSVRLWDNSLAQWHNVFTAVAIDDHWIELLPGGNTMGWSMGTPSEESDVTIDINYTPLYEGV